MNNSLSNTSWQNIKILKQIFLLFGKDNIFIVGGAVRNFLLKQTITDIDLAVKLNSTQVKNRLKKKNIKFVDLSKGHGTVTVISEANLIEITSMRVDKETYGRKAKVEFVDDIYLDSCRRDFTINSMYLNYDGKIYDPHNGMIDLKNRLIKFIGNPKDRIKEDKLRILRYFRFLSYYGYNKKTVDKDSMSACLASISGLSSISKERKSWEFFKIITGTYAADVLILMKNHNILKFLVPGLEKIKNLKIRIIDSSKKEKYLRITLLLILAKYNLKKLRESLLLSKQKFNYISKLYLNYELYNIDNLKEGRLIKYKLGLDLSHDLYYLKCLLDKKKPKKKILKILQNWEPPVLPIDGNDLKKIGFQKGNLLGKILKQIETWWVDKDFKPNKKQCLNRAKQTLINSKEL